MIINVKYYACFYNKKVMVRRNHIPDYYKDINNIPWPADINIDYCIFCVQYDMCVRGIDFKSAFSPISNKINRQKHEGT